MNEYSQFFINYQEDSHYLGGFDYFISGHQINQSNNPVIKPQKKQIIETNYIQVEDSGSTQKARTYNCINISSESRENYIKASRGTTTETMELHHSFKTILSNFIKDLIILKMLKKDEIDRYAVFLKSLPSFQSVFALFTPSSNQKFILKSQILKYLCSKLVIQKILQSRARIQQKTIMIKYIERLKKSIQKPNKYKKWKKI